MDKKKIRADQIHLRVSGPLRVALEDAASADELGLSGLCRKVLIEFATKHIVQRGDSGTAHGQV
jgi:hypothetical protein